MEVTIFSLFSQPRNPIQLSTFTRCGTERETTGIYLWSKLFVVKKGGREIAIALMDTQGSFDHASTLKECVTIFALSVMTSSVLVYNISQQIQEDHLQHLQYFTAYGELAQKENGEKPFQKLQFLVRDWQVQILYVIRLDFILSSQYPYEFGYGRDGGCLVLKKIMQVKEEMQEELKNLRNGLQSYFENIDAFLLPYPGTCVATDRNFSGKLEEVAKDFRLHIKEFCELVLSPNYLDVKKIGGGEVTAKEMVQFFQSFLNILQVSCKRRYSEGFQFKK